MKKRLNRFFKSNNEHGMALVVVLLVLVVISIMGLSLYGLAASNLKMTSGDRNYQSAYYIAESGITYEMNKINNRIPDIYKNSSLQTEFIRNFENEFVVNPIPNYDNFDASFGEKPVAKIKIESVSNGSINPLTKDYKITSTGIIGQRTRAVTKIIHLTWRPKSNIKIATNSVLFVGDNLNWSNTPATIVGTVGLGLSAAQKFTGSKSPEIITYPDVTIYNPEFPSFTIPAGTQSFSGSGLTMNNDMFINILSVAQSSTLTINVGDLNRVLIVDTLSISSYGKLKISGTGNLTIYAKNINMGTGSIINTDGDVNKLNIFPEGSVSQLNNGIIYGSMFVKEIPSGTNFSINDTTGIQGNLIAGGSGTITLNNDKKNTPRAKIIFAPLANIHANGNFVGTIIAKTFNSTGADHSFVFQPVTNSPYFIDNGTIDLSSGTLFSSEPIKEN